MLIGGRYSPPHPGLHPKTAKGDSLPHQTDIPIAKTGPPRCFHCKGYGHFASVCPSEGCYKIGPNGLPVRARDSSKDPPIESQQVKDKVAPAKSLNYMGIAQRALGATQTMKLGVLDLLSWALEARPVERLIMRWPHDLLKKTSRQSILRLCQILCAPHQREFVLSQ